MTPWKELSDSKVSVMAFLLYYLLMINIESMLFQLQIC